MKTKTRTWPGPTRERGDVDPAELIARANEIAGGAALRFGRPDLITALLCFAEFKRGARHHLADAKLGEPRPQKLSYERYLERWETTHDAVVEARAHLHAFPADGDDFDNVSPLGANYIFRMDPDSDKLKPGLAATRRKAADAASDSHRPPAERKPAAGAGCWVARRMDVHWPGHAPGVTVEAIGVYNTETGEFKGEEYVGEAMDIFMAANPREDRDALEAIYWREAEDSASSLNSRGL